MRILFMAGRELVYPRNDVLLRAFQRFGKVDVVGVEKRPASLVTNSMRLAARAIPKLISGRYDLVFVGFYGHLLMLPAGLLARKPVLFDAFVSTFDTLSSDRNVFSEDSMAGRLAFWLDRTGCRLADHVLLDTPSHAEYFAGTFSLSGKKISAIPVGCNEDIFFPQPLSFSSPCTRVLYYSSYLPLHGVETVIRAAALLKHEKLQFRLIGSGQNYEQVRRLASELGVQNVEFIQDVPLEQLPKELSAADICLGGHFGSSGKAGRVVPGKVYQILASGRPLIAASAPANLTLLSHGESAYLCPPDDAEALAAAILHLHRDSMLRRHLATGGRTLYGQACSEAIITERLHKIVMDMLG